MSVINQNSLLVDALNEQAAPQQSPQLMIPQSAVPHSVSSPEPFQTPMPLPTPAVPRSEDLYEVVRQLERQVGEMMQNAQYNPNSSVQHNPISPTAAEASPAFSQQPCAAQSERQTQQIPPGYLLVSPQELDQLVAAKVREKLQQSEMQMQHTLQVDERLKSAENTLLGISNSIGRSRDRASRASQSSSDGSDLQARYERVQRQMQQLGIKK